MNPPISEALSASAWKEYEDQLPVVLRMKKFFLENLDSWLVEHRGQHVAILPDNTYRFHADEDALEAEVLSSTDAFRPILIYPVVEEIRLELAR